MASSSSHNGNIPLTTLLEWYKIRDTLLGHNNVSQNIPLALQLSLSCQHPDARWLTEACAGKELTTKEDAIRFFPSLGQSDARALCFAWSCGDEYEMEDVALLRRSAELGFAFAQTELAFRTQGEKFKFAQLAAAAQGERDGFAWLGYCFRDGEGCEKDLERQRKTFRKIDKG